MFLKGPEAGLAFATGCRPRVTDDEMTASRIAVLTCAAVAFGRTSATHGAGARAPHAPLVLPLLLIILYSLALITPAIRGQFTGWHISGLLRHGTLFELGVLGACASCAWLLQIAQGLRDAVACDTPEDLRNPSVPEGIAVRGTVLLIVLHLTLAPLLVGTVLTVYSESRVHNAIAIPMFAAAAALGLLQASRTNDQCTPIGATAYTAAGCASCGATAALMYFCSDGQSSLLLGAAEVMILTACALAYSDCLVSHHRTKTSHGANVIR